MIMSNCYDPKQTHSERADKELILIKTVISDFSADFRMDTHHHLPLSFFVYLNSLDFFYDPV